MQNKIFLFLFLFSYLDDFIDERELYHLSAKLTAFLVSWKSEKAGFFDRVMDLSLSMAREGLWKVEDVRLIKLWLTDLVSLGFKVPHVQGQSRNECDDAVQTVKPKEMNSSELRTSTIQLWDKYSSKPVRARPP